MVKLSNPVIVRCPHRYFSHFDLLLCNALCNTCHKIWLPVPPTRNLAKVKEISEQEGNEFVQKRDPEGHTLIHWAALGGHNEIINYLLEKGVPLNEHSDNDYGPRPIHWACVHGHAVTVDLFLEQGVPIDVTDLNGCSPLVIAAQYGQSLCVSYLLQKGANKFHVDINGDSALHWAAFKGACIAHLLQCVRKETAYSVTHICIWSRCGKWNYLPTSFNVYNYPIDGDSGIMIVCLSVLSLCLDKVKFHQTLASIH